MKWNWWGKICSLQIWVKKTSEVCQGSSRAGPSWFHDQSSTHQELAQAHFSSLPPSFLVSSSITPTSLYERPSYLSSAVGGLLSHFIHIHIPLKHFWCRNVRYVHRHAGRTALSILLKSRSIPVAVNSTRVSAPVWQSELYVWQGIVSECPPPSLPPHHVCVVNIH